MQDSVSSRIMSLIVQKKGATGDVDTPEIDNSNPFSMWHGIERSEIDWHPTIDEKKCTVSGLCVVTCGEKRNVFGYGRAARRGAVMFPDNCMVGCINCIVGCLWNVISFPERTIFEEHGSLPARVAAGESAE